MVGGLRRDVGTEDDRRAENVLRAVRAAGHDLAGRVVPLLLGVTELRLPGAEVAAVHLFEQLHRFRVDRGRVTGRAGRGRTARGRARRRGRAGLGTGRGGGVLDVRLRARARLGEAFAPVPFVPVALGLGVGVAAAAGAEEPSSRIGRNRSWAVVLTSFTTCCEPLPGTVTVMSLAPWRCTDTPVLPVEFTRLLMIATAWSMSAAGGVLPFAVTAWQRGLRTARKVQPKADLEVLVPLPRAERIRADDADEHEHDQRAQGRERAPRFRAALPWRSHLSCRPLIDSFEAVGTFAAGAAPRCRQSLAAALPGLASLCSPLTDGAAVPFPAASRWPLMTRSSP